MSVATETRTQQKTGRMPWLDNLRVALIALVVLHHLAIIYGHAGPWYYLAPPTDDVATIAALLFLLFNQSWFMGLFFAISGYLTPASFDRKGAAPFARDRLMRLGAPLALYVLVLAPLATLAGSIGRGAEPPPYLDAIGLGPAWFIEVLLLFTAGYVAWRLRRSGAPRAEERPLRVWAVILFIIGLAGTTYLWRFIVPFGSYIEVVDLPSAFEAPQYVALFVAGIVAARRGWIATLPTRFGILGAVAVGIATATLLPLAILHPDEMNGGGTWQSAALALWEAVMATGLPLVLIVIFRRFLPRQGRLGRELSGSAFAVFILHALVITVVAVALSALALPPLPGFLAAAGVSLPLSFLLAAGLRRLPGLRKVL